MLKIDDFIQQFSTDLPFTKQVTPWNIIQQLPAYLNQLLLQLDEAYDCREGIAIHKKAMVEKGAVLKAPIIIAENCFVGAHAYLRGGVYLAPSVVIGPSCEIKTSIICSNSAIAHFNFIGDSIIGKQVNFEAGALTANHHNDRADKRIMVMIDGETVDTGVTKFGALVGDHSKIGANAVLSPGTLLKPNTIVKRLALIEQHKSH